MAKEKKKKRSKLVVDDGNKSAYPKIQKHLDAIFDEEDAPQYSDEFIAGVTSSLAVLLPNSSSEEIAEYILQWKRERDRSESDGIKIEIGNSIKKKVNKIMDMFVEVPSRNDLFDQMIDEMNKARYTLEMHDGVIENPKRISALCSFAMVEYEPDIVAFHHRGKLIGIVSKTNNSKTPYRSVCFFYDSDTEDGKPTSKEGNHSSQALAISKIIDTFFI